MHTTGDHAGERLSHALQTNYTDERAKMLEDIIQLEQRLIETAAAHHDLETNLRKLRGMADDWTDPDWARWYAAYLWGRGVRA